MLMTKIKDFKIKYDCTTFNNWIKSLETFSKTSFIDLARLNLLYRTLYGMTTENNAKVLISKYRRRERDMWSNEEKKIILCFMRRRHPFLLDLKLSILLLMIT